MKTTLALSALLLAGSLGGVSYANADRAHRPERHVPRARHMSFLELAPGSYVEDDRRVARLDLRQ